MYTHILTALLLGLSTPIRLFLPIPHVSPKHIHPPADFATAARRPVRRDRGNAAAAVVPADLAIALDLVHHLLREPDREVFLSCDLHGRARADYGSGRAGAYRFWHRRTVGRAGVSGRDGRRAGESLVGMERADVGRRSSVQRRRERRR